MKTSIVIVTFNAMKWIDNCLISIFQSTVLPEIIIVDNYSTDNTVKFLKDNYSKKIILIESEENLGFGGANNLGISSALQLESDFIFLLNQDTVVKKDTIEILLEVSSKNIDYGIISPIHADGNSDLLDLSFLYYINRQGQALISDAILNKEMKDVYELEMINAAAWFIPRKTFEIVGGFDPMFFLYGEDDNFCQRVLYHNLKIGITPHTTISHFSDNNYTVEFPESSEKYYHKFLNRVKVKYGNVNTEDYRDIVKLKRHFFKNAVISLLKFNFKKYKVNKTKYNLIDNKSIVTSTLENKKVGKKYLVH